MLENCIIDQDNLTIVLLSRNRLKYIDEAILSVSNQSNQNFNFIISDNSTNKEVFDYISRKYKCEIVFRGGDLTAFEHYNKVFSEHSSGWLHILHDDDVLEPNFIHEIRHIISSKSNRVAAIATNAFTYNHKVNQNWINSSKDIIFRKKEDVFKMYISNKHGGIAPFSSYVYNLNINNKYLYINNIADEYSDLIFISELIDRGFIYWIIKPLINIRIHSGSISSQSSIKSAKKIVEYIKYSTLDLNIKMLNEYLFHKIIYQLSLRKKYKLIRILRYKNLIFFLNYYYVKKLFNKLLTKL